MKDTQFYGTGLRVSAFALGTAGYGTSVGKQTAFEQMDLFYENGGNLLDTARVYGDWAPGTSGLSEKTIGEWMRARGVRDKIVLVTKGAHPPIDNMSVSRLGSQDIARDLEESLRHLQTDCVDLYLLHRDDTRIPAGEILSCLEQQAKQGKLRYYGCSNWTVQRMREARDYAAKHGLAGFCCNQICYGMAQPNARELARTDMRAMDGEFRAFHRETGMTVMGYMAANRGYFEKRFCGREVPRDVRALYDNEGNDRIFHYLQTVCASAEEISRLSLRFVMEETDFSAIPVVSFSSPGQLSQALETAGKREALTAAIQKVRGLRGL